MLDTSSVLALQNQEPGAGQALQAIADGATISTVNLSEVVAKLAQRAMPEQDIHDTPSGSLHVLLLVP